MEQYMKPDLAIISAQLSKKQLIVPIKHIKYSKQLGKQFVVELKEIVLV
jgi:hypothetical protein